MSLFDGDFDMEDATILGGIAGFAEESLREENRDLSELDPSEESVKDEADKEISLRRLRNTEPALFEHIVKLVVEHRKAWAEQRRQRELEAEQVGHEIEAMEKAESKLEG